MPRNPLLIALQRQMLLREAMASVALDNDERAHTISFDDLTPEQRHKYETRNTND